MFTPEPAIAPGGKFQVGFEHTAVFPKGITKKGGGTNEFILPSGVVLTSFGTSFVPNLGFFEGWESTRRTGYESKEFPDDYYTGQTDALTGSRTPYTTKVTISGPPEFTYNSVGVQTRDEVKDGKPNDRLGRAISRSISSTSSLENGRSSAARGRRFTTTVNTPTTSTR